MQRAAELSSLQIKTYCAVLYGRGNQVDALLQAVLTGMKVDPVGSNPARWYGLSFAPVVVTQA